ncbi:hypothetical protein CTI12_AA596140 [Artemisia annua]|uniref:Uncharacterized protein n=1 Tax=Artemisia annua TaxID=35608 RepID=A0A2U1KJJ8_ARTAN|nr:hypothetical protein CTI12_AA596140 [Artemisia annua]
MVPCLRTLQCNRLCPYQRVERLKALRWAVVKVPPLPIQLPLLISCPWCNLLSPRLVIKGNLKYPSKNYFLLWMVESLNNDKVVKSQNDSCGDCSPSKLSLRSQRTHSTVQRPPSSDPTVGHIGIRAYMRKGLFFFVELTAKFPLVLIFLMIVLYAIPASAAILAFGLVCSWLLEVCLQLAAFVYMVDFASQVVLGACTRDVNLLYEML